LDVSIKSTNNGVIVMTTVVSHIGLPEKEVTVLASIFCVISASPKINDETIFIQEQKLAIQSTNAGIDFIGDEKRRAPGRLADIVFVDGDNRFAMESWLSLKESNPLTIPIIVSSKQNLKEANGVVLKRPLMIKRVIDVLAEVTNTKNKKIHPQSSSLINILVVDDSFPVRKYMEHNLPKLVVGEIKIDFAASGEEAITKVAGQIYSLIFLDVVMPGIDGYKACKLIKSKCNSQIVMLTSRKSPFDKVRGTMSGCDAYLTKPPKDEQLTKVLEKCMEDVNSFYKSTKMKSS